jgi:hypothetical protein
LTTRFLPAKLTVDHETLTAADADDGGSYLLSLLRIDDIGIALLHHFTIILHLSGRIDRIASAMSATSAFSMMSPSATMNKHIAVTVFSDLA